MTRRSYAPRRYDADKIDRQYRFQQSRIAIARQDSATNLGPTDPGAKFRCIGFDCQSSGPVPAGGRACECADFFPPSWLRDVLTQLSAYAFYDEISGIAISHEGTRRVLRAVPDEVMSAAGLTKP